MSHAASFFTPVRSSRSFCFAGLIALAATAVTPLAQAQFAPGPNPITGTTGAQTLSSGNGTVNASGTITTTSSVAVTMSGTGTTLTNNGAIKQTGTGRGVQANGTNLQINNNTGALIQVRESDAIRAGNSSAATSVSLINAGTIEVLAGGQAIDWAGITSGANSIDNSGTIKTTGEDAVRPGKNGVITNSGTILAVPVAGSGSDGIQADSTGVQITNSGSIGGRHAITGGSSNYAITVINNVGGTIAGSSGSGINIDGTDATSTASVTNYGTITGTSTAGDGDGIDVDGTLTLNNYGIVRGLDAAGAGNNSEGVATGGGTINNYAGAEISGNISTGPGVGRGIFVDNSSGGNAFSATTVTNSGLIRGYTAEGIKIVGTFGDTVTNNAGGVIRGAGTGAVIDTGDGDDTVTNSGSIIHDGGNSQTAIALGAGNDQVTITGGSAVITGGMDGGSGGETTGDKLTFNLGAANNSVTHSGVISNFEKVEALSGKVTLNGNNTYAGTTKVGGGSFAASLRVNGRHAGGGDYTVLSGNKLGGIGIFALATAVTKIDIQNGATLQIGGGRLTLEQGSLNVDGLFSFDLNGTTAGTAGGYDQLMFSLTNTGNITLGGGSALQLNLGFAPVLGQQFELIDVVNGGTFINGTFAGLADGAFFTQGGQQFQISYFGGTGNDLVVTAIPEPSTTAAIFGLLVLSGVAAQRARNRKVVVQTEMI